MPSLSCPHNFDLMRALYTSIPLHRILSHPQADCLRALFVGMNDESCAVRALAIRLVGRLAERNPAHVNPALRKHLLQLLHDMEFSPDNRSREGASGCGLRVCGLRRGRWVSGAAAARHRVQPRQQIAGRCERV